MKRLLDRRFCAFALSWAISAPALGQGVPPLGPPLVPFGSSSLTVGATLVSGSTGLLYNNAGMLGAEASIPVPVNAQTVTSYTIAPTDQGKLVTLSNSSAIAVTVPQAVGSFAAGFAVAVQNLGSNKATLTPTTSTINGASSLVLGANEGVTLVSDGTNWQSSGEYAGLGSANQCLTTNSGATGLAWASCGSGGGGSTTLTVGSTATSGGASGALMYDSGPGTFQEATGVTATNTTLTIAGGSITSNATALSITQAWNASGTTFDAPVKVNVTNTASAAGSLLADLQVGGASKFSVNAPSSSSLDMINFTSATTNAVGFHINDTGGGGHELYFEVTGSSNGTGAGNAVLYDNSSSQADWVASASNSIGFRVGASAPFSWSSAPNNLSSFDTNISRNAAGVVQVGTTSANASGLVLAQAYQSGGVTPTDGGGACTASSIAGGSSGGKFTTTTDCSASSVKLNLATAPNGWACTTSDTTTTGDSLKESGYTTTTVTFTGTTASGDLITYQCIGF